MATRMGFEPTIFGVTEGFVENHPKDHVQAQLTGFLPLLIVKCMMIVAIPARLLVPEPTLGPGPPTPPSL